jgi:hypothetical protein
MNFTAFLDTAIGLALVYLGASLFVTTLNESLARAFRLRGRALARHLAQLFENTGIFGAIKKSKSIAPWVNSTGFLGGIVAILQGYERSVSAQKIGSYVDPKVVAQVILGELVPPPKKADEKGTQQAPAPTMEDVRKAIANLADLHSEKSPLWHAAVAAKDDVEKFTRNVSEWLDKSLHMLGEGYKKWVQVLSLALGLVVAIAGNIDTVQLTRRLYTDKELRESVAASAEQLTRNVNPELLKTCSALPLEELKKDTRCTALASLVEGVNRRNQTLAKLPIGWLDNGDICKPNQSCAKAYAVRILGWLLTALALSLGAPFWFDLLNRFVNIRGTVRREDEHKSKAG